MRHAVAGPKLSASDLRLAPMSARFLLDYRIDELNAVAQAAVYRAVTALHAQGVSTFFMEHGVLMEQAPDGALKPADAGKAVDADTLGREMR